MYLLFERLLGDTSIALIMVALYGVHPANAETVNYVIQRGDLYSTLGVIAALWTYAAFPTKRKYGLYLIPFVLAALSKPPALVFPAILFLYVLFFEEENFWRAVWKSLPAWALAIMLAALITVMTPATHVTGAISAYAYRITQPNIALHYFASFFLPIGLSADTDRQPLTSIVQAWPSILFVIMILGIAWTCRQQLAPITYRR